MTKLTEREKEAQRIILREINKALGLLEAHLVVFCETTKGSSIPLVYIQSSIEQIKEGMAKGAEMT